MKRALITGITGQDGSLLAELLLEKGYQVYGISRLTKISKVLLTGRDRNYMPRACVHITCDLINAPAIEEVIRETKPDELYHLAAQNVVSYDVKDEDETIMSNILGIKNILNTCKKYVPKCRIFFAGSSEMFGNTPDIIQNEKTCFQPRSVYGISKVSGYYLLKLYREQYGLFASCGILYNHESPRRGKKYVTRKISSYVAKIKLGKEEKLELGNLDVKRDWGCARQFVYGMWLMLQYELPLDLVLSSGKLHSVRELCDVAFSSAGLNYNDWVVSIPKFYREESCVLQGDSSLAREKVGWVHSRPFNELIDEMVKNDLRLESS